MVVEFSNVCKSYNGLSVLDDLSFQMRGYEIVCIIGPSGCGKTTMLNLVSGAIKPDKGTITNQFTKTAYVFQEDRLLPWKTVSENIRIVAKKKTREELSKIIELIGLEEFEGAYPGELSGGMRQRVSIGRALAYDANLLIMDEPFKSLDYNLKINMLKTLIDIWSKSGKAIVYVTHEIDEALLLGNRIVVFSGRPASIIKSFDIETPQEERKLTDHNLVSTRNEIIALITT